MVSKLDDILIPMMEKNNVKNIIILGHMNPDGDAAGSVMGTAHYLHMNYPQYDIHPYLAVTLSKGPKQFTLNDMVFHPFEEPKPDGNFGVIVCDTATVARMIGVQFFERAVFSIAIDHHAANEGFGDYNDVRISDACAYNVFSILKPENIEKAAQEAHPNALDYFYLGILHDTDCFARAEAGILKAASRLLELGVNHKDLEKTLHTMTLEDYAKQAKMISMVQRTMNGEVAYLVIDKEQKEEMQISYDDIHPFSGVLRDFSDVELGFTMYEEEPDLWRCSFRSDGIWINANELVGCFGGGGHKGAAGLRIACTNQEQLLSDVLEKIEEMHS